MEAKPLQKQAFAERLPQKQEDKKILCYNTKMVITVKIGRVPGALTEVALGDNATVRDALTASGLTVESFETIRVNGTSASNETTLRNGDIIHILKNVEGNI